MVKTGISKRGRHTPSGVSTPASSRLSKRQELVLFVATLCLLLAVVYVGLHS